MPEEIRADQMLIEPDGRDVVHSQESRSDMEKKRPQTVPHVKEWILSAGIMGGAYVYLSVLGYPTALYQQIRRSAGSGATAFWECLLLFFFTAIFLAAGFWYIHAMGKKPEKSSWGYFGLTVAAALWFPLFSKGDQDIAFLMILFLHGAAVYWLLTAAGSRSENFLNERALFDLGRGFFILPFGGYLRIFAEWGNLLLCAALERRKGQGKGRGWQILLGLFISLPVLCIAIPVLMGADPYFKLFTENVFSGIFSLFHQWNVASACFTLFFTLIIACYLYGLFYNTLHRPAPSPAVRRQAPQMIMGSFLVPVLLLYLVFFLVRMAGVAGAMDRIAGGQLWVSTYAREGFFELCWIAAINLAVFGLARWYSPEAGKPVRAMLSLLGAETLAFIGLAFSKMWYYIRTYHSFTFKRVMCCWLLLTLFVLFGLMTAELWNRKLKGVRIGVLFGCVTFLMLAYSNMPAWAP